MQNSTKWVIDPSHTKIGFSVKHFGITETDGFFKSFEAEIISEKNDFSEVQVDVTIDAQSIDTSDSQRDAHLLTSDFFEVEKFPTIKFKSDKIEIVGEDNYKLTGDLTIKGILKTITLNMEFLGIVPKDPFGNTKAGLLITGKINRKDFGVTWNANLDHGGVAVSETVKLNIPIQLLKVK